MTTGKTIPPTHAPLNLGLQQASAFAIFMLLSPFLIVMHLGFASLRTSLCASTTPSIVAHSSHWSNVSGTVPNARLRKPKWMTATCSGTDTDTDTRSHPKASG